ATRGPGADGAVPCVRGRQPAPARVPGGPAEGRTTGVAALSRPRWPGRRGCSPGPSPPPGSAPGTGDGGSPAP
ncbi:hypothetical protein ABTE67_18955, partial [Acinetobacter baumannii]